MAINRPLQCEQKSIYELSEEVNNYPYLWSKELHKHYNIDGFRENASIYYGFLSMDDSNTWTGTTAIVPFSHLEKNIKLINENTWNRY